MIHRVPIADLRRLSSGMEMGIRSGRDWRSILQWLSLKDSSSDLRKFLSELTKKLEFATEEEVFRSEKSKVNDLCLKMFFEILLQSQKGVTHFSQLFNRYASILTAVEKLKRQEKSLLFVPQFQAWMALLTTLFFTFALPFLVKGMFPSFILLGRFDLFAIGVFIILVGLGLLLWLCSLPRRHLKPLLSKVFFFYFLSIYIESGLDLISSWNLAREATQVDSKLKISLHPGNIQIDRFDESLEKWARQLSNGWPEVLIGILWARVSGSQLSKFLRDVSEREGERLMAHWEDELRKLTLFTLLPLGFFIFPGTLFLLIGPQLLELTLSL